PVTAAPWFPVDWDPLDAELTWFRGEINFPKPVSPLFASWLKRVFDEGGTRALRVGGPPIRFTGKRINTFWYEADVPLDLSPDERAAWVESSEKALDDSLERLGDLWEREYLPEVQTTVTVLERTPLEALSDQRLAVHLEYALARSIRAWEIHFLALTPAMVALNEFEKLCVQIFGEDGSLAAFEMLQGFDNKTLAMERALRALARAAADNQVVVDVLIMKPPGDVVEALRRDSHAADFVRELDAFLTVYGRRCERFELMVPTWRDDPTPVIETIRLLLDAPKEPARSIVVAAERRERAVATAQDRWKDLPSEMQERFGPMLAAAQAAIVITEDHAFHIDGALQFEIRRLVLECGRRLVKRRLLADEDDIFMLTLEEMTSCLADDGPDFRGEVSTRRAEMERWALVKAPAMLGTPTAEESGRSAEAWASFGGRRVSESTPDGAIKGVAASAGRASGTARVIATPRDARRLMPGDVLVVEATAPTWAPLLSSVSALISERGGPLSHCAILAREYGVPAVVGVDGATRRIRDGDIVEVDGSAGLIRIVHPERARD
ncbi:MAG TPA: PEP-utilizing enzyme, partial [Actinomycetota bacterium]|nr:PEP-utilizing enzyme [Actinomycetota bacterium]